MVIVSFGRVNSTVHPDYTFVVSVVLVSVVFYGFGVCSYVSRISVSVSNRGSLAETRRSFIEMVGRAVQIIFVSVFIVLFVSMCFMFTIVIVVVLRISG